MRTRLLTLLVVLAVWFLGGGRSEQAWGGVVRLEVLSLSEAERLDRFEAKLEALRQEMGIPALSAAIVKDQHLIWAQGFGHADPHRNLEARPDTAYHLASLTKPLSAVVVMQLVEEGKLSLDDPVSKFGIRVDSPGTVRVRNLLNHTSQDVPGSDFRYDGGPFDLLTTVAEQATGRTFRELVYERILDPLQMTDTASNPWGSEGFLASLGFVLGNSNTQHVYRALAKPYHLDQTYQPIHGGSYIEAFSAATGLISTVEDMATFDIAMDKDLLVSPATKEQMFSPAISSAGSTLPYGLGWFVQEYDSTQLLWHYGYWYCASSLILKVPEENLTLIVLANSEELSRPYKLGHKHSLILNSPVALTFYELFVFEPRRAAPGRGARTGVMVLPHAVRWHWPHGTSQHPTQRPKASVPRLFPTPGQVAEGVADRYALNQNNPGTAPRPHCRCMRFGLSLYAAVLARSILGPALAGAEEQRAHPGSPS
jgi:CubicO group peptidase (beta-lactamase class C family)